MHLCVAAAAGITLAGSGVVVVAQDVKAAVLGLTTLLKHGAEVLTWLTASSRGQE